MGRRDKVIIDMPKRKKQAPTEVESVTGAEIAPGQVTLEEAISAAEKGGATEALIGSFRKVQEALWFPH